MTKEHLTKDNIKHDLLLSIRANYNSTANWRLESSIAGTALAIIVGFIFKNIWIGLLIFTIAAYQMVRYIIAEKKFKRKVRAAEDAVMREEFIISLETLEKVRQETIYEPHNYGGKHYSTREAYVFYFVSGIKWRMPGGIGTHYAWSKEHYISRTGLNNTSVGGNEFYFVKLESDPKVSYIYNTKFFELEEEY